MAKHNSSGVALARFRPLTPEMSNYNDYMDIVDIVAQAGATLNVSNNVTDVSTATVTATGSSSTRSLATRFAQEFNVKDYGAIGDGTTNDVAAIQAAINAASSAGGGSVFLPTGTYLVNTECLLASNIRIHGDGIKSNLIPGSGFHASGSSGILGTLSSASYSNIVIENLCITGSSTASTGNSPGAHNIVIKASTSLSSLVIRNVTTQTAGACGVMILPTVTGTDILIDGIEASNNASDGIQASSVGTVGNLTIVNCNCNYNGRSGIDIGSDGSQILISNNQCVGNATYGIYADGGQTPMTFSSIISGNIVNGSVNGVATTANGIAATFTRYTKIVHNDVSMCQVGVYIANSNDCLIQGNSIYQNTTRGINCDITGNYVVNPPAGVARDTNAALYRIVDTALVAFITPTRVSILDNHILDNTSYGLWIKNGQRWLIMGNVFENTISPGVQLNPVFTTVPSAATFPAWVNGTAYVIGSLVSDGGTYYQSLANHTALSTDEPGVGVNWATYWIASLVQPWVTSHSYAVGDAVWVSSAFYVCSTAHTSGATTQPGVGGSWQTVWTLQTITLDSFTFSHNFSKNHTTSDAIVWNAAGTNVQIFYQQGTTPTPLSSPGTGASSEQIGASATTGVNATSTAIGNSATTATTGATNAVAIGYLASAQADSSTAIGQGASCNSSSNFSTAIGASAACTQANNVAIGRSAAASGNPSIALGYRSAAGANTISLGGAATSASWFTNVNFAGARLTTTGISLNFQGTTTDFGTAHTYGIINASFSNNTEATWSGNLSLNAPDHTSASRIGVQIQSNGSAVLLGLFGVTPVVKPVGGGNDATNFVAGSGTPVTSTSTWTGATGASTYTVGDIVTALKNIGALTV